MTYVEAAVEVLKRAREPLTAAELTERAIAKKLIRPGGRTPKATMEAALYGHVVRAPKGHIRRLCVQGPNRARRGSVRWTYAP